MNLDVINDLFFICIGRNVVWPTKINCKDGEDPLTWLAEEVKRRSPKVVKEGDIIGEATSFNPESGKVGITYYDNPVPIMTDADWEEWARMRG